MSIVPRIFLAKILYDELKDSIKVPKSHLNGLQILKDKHNCYPLFYYRCVDDTILYVQQKFIDQVLNIFNSQDKNLQFTFEVQQNNQINFLDWSLIIKENKIISN